ncbi:MAG: transposase [Bdellovibrionaceae bacterium]|nr:transposase [Pseudobdellovibrionaceae bacterium]|tara:strand:+ start:100 stop:1293 length:1194 start_codon:yes stop_codon:yes gene_type:complete
MSQNEAELGEILKRKELIEKALCGELKWVEVAEILHLSPRQVRRLRSRFESKGTQGLQDYRKFKTPQNKISEKVIREILDLYRSEYRDWNVTHFHEKLTEDHGIQVSYAWLLKELHRSKLIAQKLKSGPPKMRRERKPLPGMLLQIDGSEHAWLGEEHGNFCLVGIIDDSNNEVYSARFFSHENLESIFYVLRETIEKKGIFCSLYADRASHFFVTKKAGEGIDLHRRTQCQIAMEQLGVQMIPAYSPQAKGRIERLWGTFQGRLPQELKSAGIKTMDKANEYLTEIFIPHYNKKFKKQPKEKGSAFIQLHPHLNLDHVFSIKTERTVQYDNTISYKTKTLQIPASDLRISYAKCKVTVLEHMNGTYSVIYGPQVIGKYDAQGKLILTDVELKKTGS